MADLPKFHGIIADPPWRFAQWSERGKGKSAENHYNCLSLDDIKALPVADLAAKDCLLWLWTTGPFLRNAMEVIDAWGFSYKTSGNWNKITRHGKSAFGTGYWLRGSSEPYLIATRGNPKIYSRSERSSFSGLVRQHSQKPPEAVEQFVRMTISPRLEMFSRENHPGIDAVWGQEAGKFGGLGTPSLLSFDGNRPDGTLAEFGPDQGAQRAEAGA